MCRSAREPCAAPGARRQAGFTLIEMMIVVVIVAILAVVVLPSYQSYVQKARRTEAKAAMTSAAQMLERYATEKQIDGYRTAILSDNRPPPANAVAALTTENGYYQLGLVADASTFVLSAVPQRSQLNDTCGTLTLNHRGERGVYPADDTKARECWQ